MALKIKPPTHRADALGVYISPRDTAWDNETWRADMAILEAKALADARDIAEAEHRAKYPSATAEALAEVRENCRLTEAQIAAYALRHPVVRYHRGLTRFQPNCDDWDAEGKPCHVHGISVALDGGEPVRKEFDVTVCAQDVPGIKKLLPESFRKHDQFDKIYKLEGVPVATVQLRFDGWVTEMQDMEAMKHVKADLSDGKAAGIDNLLYSADAEFSCFADLALTSPADYYKEGEGSLMQCVLTPADRFMKMDPQEVADITSEQVYKLFPSAKEQGLKVTWSNVVKLSQSLYREAPGMDKFRPDQSTPIPNFFLSGSYTYQDYIDSMEGATKSGLMTAKAINDRTPAIAKSLKERNSVAA